MDKHSPLADRLVEYVETRIVSGEYRVGSRIPSVRRLAAKFDLSYGTVYRSLEYLCQTGILERRGSSGIFVKSRRVLGGGGSGRIAVIMAPYVMERDSGLCLTAFMGVQDLALKYGYSLQLNYLPLSSITEDILLEALRDVDGAILLNEYDERLSEFPPLNIPAVGMLMQNSYNGRIGLVNLDVIDVIRTAVRFFLEQRSFLRKVIVYSSDKPLYATRAHLFRTFYELSGGTVEMWFQLPTKRTVYEKDCGYFFTSDQWANIACSVYFENTGELLTDRHLILGVDGKQFLDPDFFSFPTITLDWRRVGEVLMDEVIRQLHDDHAFPRNINICGKLTIPSRPPN